MNKLTSCLGVLSTDTESVVMPQTSVALDLLQALEILTELGVDTVSKDLGVLAIDDVALPVKEPSWDLVLCWVLDDGDDSLELFGGKFTGTIVEKAINQSWCFHTMSESSWEYLPLVEINIGLLADQVGVASSDTLDLGQGVHDLLFTLNVGVEETKDELKVRLLAAHERLYIQKKALVSSSSCVKVPNIHHQKTSIASC